MLVVEDDPLLRRTLVRILSARGFVIVEASSLPVELTLPVPQKPFGPGELIAVVEAALR